ncbi:MAG: hypothetical protein II838_05870 [Lachnospiraceae bacterium]|nr:hypothetical protein [Lachnospiraceae bacterium]
MDFKVTKKNKKKAIKNRIRKEKKLIWIIPRFVATILYIVSIVSFYVGIFVIPYNDYEKLEIFGFVFAATLVIAVMLSAFVKNLASHWIEDRLNEKLWMDEKTLYHFQQVAFAAGLNIRSADSTGYTFALSLSSIRNVKYDEKSRRIEFLADGTCYYYSDVRRQIVDEEWSLNGYEAIFYDYFEPSLIETLKSKAINVEVRELNSYSVFDNTI